MFRPQSSILTFDFILQHHHGLHMNQPSFCCYKLRYFVLGSLSRRLVAKAFVVINDHLYSFAIDTLFQRLSRQCCHGWPLWPALPTSVQHGNLTGRQRIGLNPGSGLSSRISGGRLSASEEYRWVSSFWIRRMNISVFWPLFFLTPFPGPWLLQVLIESPPRLHPRICSVGSTAGAAPATAGYMGGALPIIERSMIWFWCLVVINYHRFLPNILLLKPVAGST